MYYTEKEIKVIKQRAYDKGFISGIIFLSIMLIIAISTILYFI